MGIRFFFKHLFKVLPSFENVQHPLVLLMLSLAVGSSPFETYLLSLP